ncbi:MAG: hypothetical protein AB7J40_03135 [Candidatus Altimarinota bacterium]
MADSSKNHLEKKEAVPSAPTPATRPSVETPKEVSSSRVEIAGTLIEGQDTGEFVESGEIREVAGESREVKGDGVAAGKKKDDGQAAAQTGAAATTTFTFDEHNLPPAPVMIKKIEETLRSEIRKLEKDARRYQGGIFRQPNPEKFSATMIEIRRKNVLLKRLVTMASEVLKRMFLQMFGSKK